MLPHPPPSHRDRGTLEFDIAMNKFPKMFDEDSILRIRGPCDDCDCGWRVTKIVAEKIILTFRFFLALFFRHPLRPCDDCDEGGSVGAVA